MEQRRCVVTDVFWSRTNFRSPDWFHWYNCQWSSPSWPRPMFTADYGIHQDMKLRPGKNEIKQVEWRFHPQEANSDVTKFVSQYLSKDKVGIVVHLKEIIGTIPTDQYQINAVVRCINAQLVNRVDMYPSGLDRRLGLKVEFGAILPRPLINMKTHAYLFDHAENPFELPMTVSGISMDVSLLRRKIIQVNDKSKRFDVPVRLLVIDISLKVAYSNSCPGKGETAKCSTRCSFTGGFCSELTVQAGQRKDCYAKR